METVKLYVVQKDDTMAEIARKHGMTIDAFRKMNTELTDGKLAQGMKVKVAVGKQPLKHLEQETRSEKAKQPSKAQAPQMKAAVQAQPKPVAPAAAPIAKPKTPIGSQTMNVAPQPNVQGMKKPAAAPAAVKSEGNAVKAPAQQADFSKVFYPKESQYPMTEGMSGYWNQPGGAAQPANTGKQPYSPAAQGYPVMPAGPAPQMNPYYPLSAESQVSPAYQAGPSGPYYPAPAAQGYPENPNVAGLQMAPYYPLSPASQAVPPNPYYPAPMENPAVNPASYVSPYSPAANENAVKPYNPAVQGKSAKPAKSPAQQVSPALFSQGPIHVDQPYTPANAPGVQSPAVSPWTNPEMMGPTTTAPAFQEPGAQVQTLPDYTTAGKAGSPAPGAIGGYPYPYMPGLKNPEQPCGCGGPVQSALYPPYSPVGYYGGNQPPQPVPYTATSPAYQPGQTIPSQKKK